MNRVSRRNLLKGLAIGLGTLGAGALGACGGAPAAPAAGTEAQATTAPAAAEEKFTLEMMVDFQDDYIKYSEEQLNPRLKEIYPGSNVEIIPLDWSRLEEQLLTSKAAGAMPDLFRMGATFVPIAADNVLSLTLDERMAEWGTEDDFYPASINNCRWKGKLWGLPQLTSPRHYCYRKDITDEVGVEISDEWTWDDMLDAAGKLTIIEDGKLVRMGCTYANDMQEWWGVLSAFGGELIMNSKAAFNDEAGLASLEWVKARNHAVSPEGTAPLAESPIPYIATGQLVIAYAHPGVHWTNVKRYAPEHTEDIVVPQPPLKARRVCKMNTDWLALAVTSKYPDAAWEFMKLQMDVDALAAFNESFGFIPPRKSSAAKAEYMQHPVMKKVESNMASYGEPFKIIPLWQKFSLVLQPNIEAVTLGLKTAEEALAEMETGCNEIMKDYPEWPDTAA